MIKDDEENVWFGKYKMNVRHWKDTIFFMNVLNNVNWKQVTKFR